MQSMNNDQIFLKNEVIDEVLDFFVLLSVRVGNLLFVFRIDNGGSPPLVLCDELELLDLLK